MVKVPNFAYTSVCVYFPLSTLFLLHNNDTMLKLLLKAVKPNGSWLYMYVVHPLRSELDNFKDNMNSSKPAAFKHLDPRITWVGNNVPGIHSICPH